MSNDKAIHPPPAEEQEQPQPSIHEQLASLRDFVAKEFPGVVEQLEAGTQIILVSATRLRKHITPDWQCAIGALTLLCQQYGAMTLFMIPGKAFKIGDSI